MTVGGTNIMRERMRDEKKRFVALDARALNMIEQHDVTIGIEGQG